MSDANENPYASPQASEPETVAIAPDQVPRGLTFFDSLMLVSGLGMGILLLAATQGPEGLSVASANDAESLYSIYSNWIQLLAQAAAWAILARTWRHGAMPRAWEWILLFAWVVFWPGQPIRFASPMHSATFTWPVGWTEIFAEFLQWGWTFVPLLAVFVALGIYLRLKTRLTAIARVVSLLGLFWLCFSGLVTSGGLSVSGTTNLYSSQFARKPLPEWLPVILIYVAGLPQTIKWGIPLFAGFAGGFNRRWPEWAGLSYFLMMLSLTVWSTIATWSSESAIMLVSYAIGLGLSPLILGWRRRLIDWLRLSDVPTHGNLLREQRKDPPHSSSQPP